MLTDAAIKRAKSKDKSYHQTDSNGLSILIMPTGSKVWRYRYRFNSKAKMISFGPYPEVSLAEARQHREEARKLLRSGVDPSAAKKKQKLMRPNEASTFEAIAREWFNLQKSSWSERHADEVIHTLTRDVFPDLGDMQITEITPPEVLSVLRKIEKRPAIETAHRVRQRMSAVFVFAIAIGKGSSDPASIVQKALAPIRKGRHPAAATLEEARAIIQAIDGETAHPVTRLAMRMLALTAVRPGSLAATPWSEFADVDEDNPVWTIPAERMKMTKAMKSDDRNDHRVPLSRQALETIKAVRLLTGKGPYVFPNARNAHKPMSENALGYLLNRAGYHHRHVPHGWRATFSTIMNDNFPADRFIIDAMLAHKQDDKVEAAYNRASHMARRQELAQIWADMLLDGMLPASDLLVGRRRSAQRIFGKIN